MQIKPFSPSQVLKFVTKMFEPLLEAKHLSLTQTFYGFLEMPEDLQAKQKENIRLINTTNEQHVSALPEFLSGDERRLKQVLINLVKNAKKFTDEGGIDIKVSYSVANTSLIFHISDTGVGIAKQDLPKLFNRFGKLERTASQNSEGIGLGLTIVKAIVEKAGG